MGGDGVMEFDFTGPAEDAPQPRKGRRGIDLEAAAQRRQEESRLGARRSRQAVLEKRRGERVTPEAAYTELQHLLCGGSPPHPADVVRSVVRLAEDAAEDGAPAAAYEAVQAAMKIPPLLSYLAAVLGGEAAAVLPQKEATRVRMDAYFALSVFAMVQPESLAQHAGGGLFATALRHIDAAEVKMKREALHYLEAAVQYGAFDIARALVEAGGFDAVVGLMKTPDVAMMTTCLHVAYNLLWWGDDAARREGGANPFMEPFIRCGGTDSAAELLEHQHEGVAEAARQLIDAMNESATCY